MAQLNKINRLTADQAGLLWLALDEIQESVMDTTAKIPYSETDRENLRYLKAELKQVLNYHGISPEPEAKQNA